MKAYNIFILNSNKRKLCDEQDDDDEDDDDDDEYVFTLSFLLIKIHSFDLNGNNPVSFVCILQICICCE